MHTNSVSHVSSVIHKIKILFTNLTLCAYKKYVTNDVEVYLITKQIQWHSLLIFSIKETIK